MGQAEQTTEEVKDLRDAVDTCNLYVHDLEAQSNVLHQTIEQCRDEAKQAMGLAAQEKPQLVPWYAYVAGGLVLGFASGAFLFRH